MTPIKFTVSAPGKVILNGEHSVVYNKPALAGVIGLRNYITLSENFSDYVTINFDLFSNACVTFPLHALNEFLAEIQSKYNTVDLPNELETLHDEYYAKVYNFILRNKTCETQIDESHQVNLEKTLSSIIYLLTAIEANVAATNGTPLTLSKGFTLDFKSEIPTSAGLGSSAAFAVCIAATFYTYALSHAKPSFVQTFNANSSNEEQLFFKTTISMWAFISERIMHGTPSGLDNTICTFGNVVQFTKHPKKIIDVHLKSKINVMLVNSGVSRNTLEVVRRVKELRIDHGQLTDSIMDAMGALVTDVVEILENKEPHSDMANYEKLKRLFTINNNLLRALGVSHPVLEEIFAISERFGFGSKLTGAGAGGYAIILLPPLYADNESFRELCNHIKSFEYSVTTIGGSGLQIVSEN